MCAIPACLQPLDVVATAAVAWGRVVVMGDADGRLVVWDTAAGKSSALQTG